MKRTAILTSSVCSLIFVLIPVISFAGRSTPVTVVNESTNPVIVEDINACGKTPTSAFLYSSEPNVTNVIMTVPNDKLFVLKDVLISRSNGRSAKIEILEVDEPKAFFVLPNDLANNVGVSANPLTRAFNFSAGIPFSPGSEIKIQNTDWASWVTISGYLIDP